MVILPKLTYSSIILALLRIISEQNESICYVSANKPEKTFTRILEVNDIDRKKFLIIDCAGVGDRGRQPGDGAETIFVDSPRDLTNVSIGVTDAINRGVENIVFDALSTFMIYGEGLVVVRFAHSLISKIRTSERKGVFIVLKDEISRILLDDLCMFIDAVIDFEANQI